jgi:hypothetical protein
MRLASARPRRIGNLTRFWRYGGRRGRLAVAGGANQQWTMP